MKSRPVHCKAAHYAISSLPVISSKSRQLTVLQRDQVTLHLKQYVQLYFYIPQHLGF
jgi:hypothetical protein